MKKIRWILFSGPPGVGKSTLANLVSKNLSLALIDKDSIDEPFSPDSRGEEYTRTIEPKVLTAIFNLCERNFSNGISMLVDLPFTHILVQSPEVKTKVLNLVRQFDLDLHIFELYLDEHQLKKRIQDRGLKRDKAKLSVDGWEKFKASDHIDKRIDLPHIAIDASLDIAQKLAIVLKALGK